MECEEIVDDVRPRLKPAGSWRPLCMDGEPPLGECDTMTPVDACAYPEEDIIRLWFDDQKDRAKGLVAHGYWRFVVAHEWAHAIQDEEGILGSGRFTPDELEIQADNFARALGYIPPAVFMNDDPNRPYRATDQGAIETCRLFEASGNDYC